jgi:hypothetical protein
MMIYDDDDDDDDSNNDNNNNNNNNNNKFGVNSQISTGWNCNEQPVINKIRNYYKLTMPIWAALLHKCTGYNRGLKTSVAVH